MTSELDTLNIASSYEGIHAGTARRMSPEDLSPPPTPISPAKSPALLNKLENSQGLFEVRLVRQMRGKIYTSAQSVTFQLSDRSMLSLYTVQGVGIQQCSNRGMIYHCCGQIFIFNCICNVHVNTNDQNSLYDFRSTIALYV